MNKGIKNIAASLISQVLLIGLGIIIPRLVLVNLGSESNGLLSSISGFLSYLALLESGVGLATQQALYKPIADNNQKAVNEILSATNYYYKRIGKIYIGIVVVISAVYTVTVTTSIPKMTVFTVILLSGLSATLNYLFSSKYSLYLISEGKSYISTVIITTFSIATNISKILLLVWGGGILHLQIMYFLIGALQAFVICRYMNKHYPWMDCNSEPNYDAIGQRHAVLVHKIAGLVFTSTDVILLTYFCNLRVVSVYNMYAMLFSMMKSVAVSFSDGFIYALGQNYSNKKLFDKLFNAFEVCNMAVTFAVFCVGYILTLPFLRLYTAGIDDINYIDPLICLLFAAYYLLESGRKSSLTVANIAEKFEETKWRSVLEAVINLTVSIIATWKFGIYGVLLGTIAGLLYRTTDAILYASKLMEKPAWLTFARWFRNMTVFCVFVFCASKIPVKLDNYLVMIIYGVLLSITSLSVYMLINYLREPKVFSYIVEIVSERFHRLRRG